jgi:sterol desaturase/sphingolipid hydroxylase (fatty acid hydroxylase superfamily)
MGTLLLIVLVLLLLGAFPRWGYNQNWGYGPSGLIGLILVIVLILVLLDHIPYRF